VSASPALVELDPRLSKDERETPVDLFHALDGEFLFTLDAAASHVNHKCARYCTLEGAFANGEQIGMDTGVHLSWAHERVWCNPPFSWLDPWLAKAWDDQPDVACLLLPANRMEQPLWHRYVEPYRDRAGSPLTTRFLAGRRHFTVDGGKPILNKDTGKRSAPEFGIVLCIWDRRVPGALRR
jgi:hypothetical protein